MQTILLEVRSVSLDALTDALGQPVAGQSSRRPHSDSTRFHVGLVLNKVTMWQGFLRVFLFSPAHIVSQMLHLHVAVTRSINGPSLRIFQTTLFQKMTEHWIENTPAFMSPTVIRTSGRSLAACIQSNAVAVIGEHRRGHCFHVVFECFSD